MLIFFRNQKRTEKENSNSLEVLKFETAGGDFPILMSPSPLGSPAAPAGKVKEMRKYQKHNWIKYNLIKRQLWCSQWREEIILKIEISQNVSKMCLEEFPECICFKEMSFCRCKEARSKPGH